MLGWLDPDTLFGNLLTPMVTLAVGLILFEGGLSLTRAELATGGRVVPLLLTVGVGVTFACTALLALSVLGLPGDVSAVLAAVLVVTGPTVVGPLLATIRPEGAVGPVLKAEGILIDPVGAVLAALIFEAGFEFDGQARVTHVLGGLAVFALVGLGIGLAGALLAVVLLRRYLVPDSLTTALGVALALGAFAAANAIVDESGLLAVTIMGIAIGSQRRREVRLLLDFNETVRVLLIASLFVVLGARITTAEIEAIRWQTFVFVAGLILVVRPLVIAICTIGSALDWRARVFAAWMAPTGHRGRCRLVGVRPPPAGSGRAGRGRAGAGRVPHRAGHHHGVRPVRRPAGPQASAFPNPIRRACSSSAPAGWPWLSAAPCRTRA